MDKCVSNLALGHTETSWKQYKTCIDYFEQLIAGQEDDTIAFDGEITITPFNMKEEMQTGHFDTAGTYIFSKEVQYVYPPWYKYQRNSKLVNLLT